MVRALSMTPPPKPINTPRSHSGTVGHLCNLPPPPMISYLSISLFTPIIKNKSTFKINEKPPYVRGQ
jgi:hypothetical protein